MLNQNYTRKSLILRGLFNKQSSDLLPNQKILGCKAENVDVVTLQENVIIEPSHRDGLK